MDKYIHSNKLQNALYFFHVLFPRYIIHNDMNNPLISSFNAFDKVLGTYDPDLLVISGLQMMDNYPFQEGNFSVTILLQFLFHSRVRIKHVSCVLSR